MALKNDRKGLGRGLSALMADIEHAPAGVNPAKTLNIGERLVPIDQIFANPDQPRRAFSEDALDELTKSIHEKGIIQPLILRPYGAHADQYQIVAGERRWRAAQKAQLHEVPAIIRDFNDSEVLEIAIIENIQRTDLNPMEEAQGYRQLIDRFGHTQDQLSKAMGKSRSHIANLMRLLSLPDDVQDFVRDGTLTAGHARVLVTQDNPYELAKKIMAQGLSVREVENLVKSIKYDKKTKKPKPNKDADTLALESDLSAALGMSVRIDHDGETGKGRLLVQYKDLQGLDDLMRLLGGDTKIVPH